MFKFIKFIKTFACVIFISTPGFSQIGYYTTYYYTTGNIWDLGGEYQYNSGNNFHEQNAGIRYDGFQKRSNWNIGLTYNFGESKGNAVKENGFGFSAGYRYGFGYSNTGNGNLFAGPRLTFEFNNRKDASGKIIAKETLFIPKIESGYQFIFNTHGFAAPSVGYGYGIKLKGEEAKTDEGGRFITGLSIGYRF